MNKAISGKNFEGSYLQWDTDYFGIKSAKINLIGEAENYEQNKIMEFCENFDFVTISNMNNLEKNNFWIGSKTNAFLVDVNIQFLKSNIDVMNYDDKDTYIMNNLSRNERIIYIAKNSFNYSRFFNDPFLPGNNAKNIYLHWTECSFLQEKKYFVISEKNGVIAGFILFSLNENAGLIELVAVDEKYQGQGVGKSLIYTMEAFVNKKGIKKIKVGTQVNNISAASFYLKLGFSYVNCSSIYHYWKK